MCVYTKSSVAFGPAFIPSPQLWPCFCQQWTEGVKSSWERKKEEGGQWRRGREGKRKREEGGLSPWTDGLLFLNTCGTMFRLSLPSSWSRIRRSVGPRHSFVLHTSQRTHADTRTSIPVFPSAHMLKSSPLLSASKTQHPRLLCCCQVLPLADATGESYPSEVGVPGEHQAPRYVQPPLMWTQTCEHNLENIIYTVRLCTCLDIYKLR